MLTLINSLLGMFCNNNLHKLLSPSRFPCKGKTKKLKHVFLKSLHSFNVVHQSAVSAINREFKIPRRRWPRKHRLKSEFAFFQSLSWLLELLYFVKSKRTLFEPNSQESYSSSERERKFSRRLFTSSIKREIRHFPVVVVQWQRSEMHV